MKQIKRIYWAAAACLVLLVVLASYADRFTHTWKGDQLWTGHEIAYDGSLIADYHVLEAGELAQLGDIVIKQPGQYRLIIRYDGDTTGSYVEVSSREMLNPDNTTGRLLATQPLDPATKETTVTFEVEAPISDLNFAIHYGGGTIYALHNVTLANAGPIYYTDLLLLAALVLCCAVLLYRWLFGRPLQPGESYFARLRAVAPVALVLGAGLLASYPFFMEGIVSGHDTGFHLARIRSIAEGWQSGQFPVRVYPTFVSGKGYLAGAMYPDLFLWPAAALRLCGVSLWGCYKFTFIAVNIASAATAWYAGRRLFGRQLSAAVCCVLYTFAQYRLACVHIRGALGEALAMVFLPVLVVGLYEVFFGNLKKWPVLTAGVLGIFQAHTLTLLIAGLMCVLFGLIFLPRLLRGPGLGPAGRPGPRPVWQAGRLLALAKAAGLTLALGLWFLVPFAYFSTQPLKIFGQTQDIAGAALDISQLFMGGFSPIRAEGAYFAPFFPSPGLALLFCGVLALAALAVYAVVRAQPPAVGANTKLYAAFATPAAKAALRFCAVALPFALLALWLCTNWAPWTYFYKLPVLGRTLATIQFPWRFFSLASCLLALCGGAVAGLFAGTKRQALALVAVLACLLAAGQQPMLDSVLYSASHHERDSREGVNHLYDGQYLYEGTNRVLLSEPDPLIHSDNSTLQITNYTKTGTTLRFTYAADRETWLTLPLTWYPGYKAAAGGAALPNLAPDDIGHLRVLVPAGENTVTVWYAGQPFFRVSDAISLLTLAGCGIYIIIKKRRKTAP